MAGLPQILLAALAVTVLEPGEARADQNGAAAFYGEYVISYLGLPVG